MGVVTFDAEIRWLYQQQQQQQQQQQHRTHIPQHVPFRFQFIAAQPIPLHQQFVDRKSHDLNHITHHTSHVTSNW